MTTYRLTLTSPDGHGGYSDASAWGQTEVKADRWGAAEKEAAVEWGEEAAAKSIGRAQLNREYPTLDWWQLGVRVDNLSTGRRLQDAY